MLSLPRSRDQPGLGQGLGERTVQVRVGYLHPLDPPADHRGHRPAPLELDPGHVDAGPDLDLPARSLAAHAAVVGGTPPTPRGNGAGRALPPPRRAAPAVELG